jgi:hypothetical protein
MLAAINVAAKAASTLSRIPFLGSITVRRAVNPPTCLSTRRPCFENGKRAAIETLSDPIKWGGVLVFLIEVEASPGPISVMTMPGRVGVPVSAQPFANYGSVNEDRS